jgi:TRAP-type C4-dicarboxylate transport system substrate-binding protein
MYEPVIASKRTLARLKPEQRKALLAAAKKAEEYFDQEVRKGDKKLMDTYKKAGVEVTEMSKAEFDAWLTVAKASSYKNFAEKVKGGDELIRKALAVE